MLTLPTPAAVAIGRAGGRLLAYDIETGKYYEAPVGAGEADIAELKIEGLDVRAHVVLASYSTSLIKALAVDGDADLLDSSGIRRLRRGRVTLQMVKNKEFGKWDDVWNKLILIKSGAGFLALGASRAGALLHLNIARTDELHVKTAVEAINKLRSFGEISAACSCRLGLLPIEIIARRGTEYILVKIYMNIQIRRSNTIIVIKGSSGNIDKRFIGPLENLNLYIGEAEGS